MKIENKEKKESVEKKSFDISKYTGKISKGGNTISKEVVDKLELFFSNMKSGDVVDNGNLVLYLEEEGVKINNSIKTDVPLYGSKQCPSIQSGVVLREKVNPSNKSSRWIYTRV